MTPLYGAQRIVLRALKDSPRDSAGFVADAQVALAAKMPIEDVLDWFETLEQDGYIEVAQTEVGLSASINGKGRLAIRPFSSQPEPKQRRQLDEASMHRTVGGDATIDVTAEIRLAEATIVDIGKMRQTKPLRRDVRNLVSYDSDAYVLPFSQSRMTTGLSRSPR